MFLSKTRYSVFKLMNFAAVPEQRTGHRAWRLCDFYWFLCYFCTVFALFSPCLMLLCVCFLCVFVRIRGPLEGAHHRVLRIAIKVPSAFGTFDWKCSKNGELPLKNDDFLLTDGALLLRFQIREHTSTEGHADDLRRGISHHSNWWFLIIQTDHSNWWFLCLKRWWFAYFCKNMMNFDFKWWFLILNDDFFLQMLTSGEWGYTTAVPPRAYVCSTSALYIHAGAW